MLRGTLLTLLIALTVAYPLAVYYGLQHVSPRIMAAALAAIIGLRLLTDRQRRFLPVGLVLLVFSAVAIWRDDLTTLRLYPVLVNLVMLGLFSWTLLFPPSLIERLARLKEPDLPPSGVRYTRRVTQVWCGFFVLNGSIAAYTALYSSLATWTLYNGLISYLLMGTLFGGEFLLRLRIRKQPAP